MSADEGHLLQMLIAARDVREVVSEIAWERLASRKLDQLALARAVAQTEIPSLIEQLEQIVPPEEEA